MSDARSIESLLCVATTPAQAKALLATLMAAGIPARTDGDALADEFAASMRLMNLMGTKVYVPTASLVRARAIATPEPVDLDELTRQALAAAGPESQPDERPARGNGASSTPRSRRQVGSALICGLALLAAILRAAAS